MQSNRGQSGVTLVDVMAASLLVAVALVGTAGAVFSAALLEEATARKRNSTRAVSSLMADLRASDVDTLVADHDGTTHSIDFGGGQPATATVSVAEATTGSAWPVYRVEIEVAYADSGAHDNLKFVTHVSDHRDSVGAGTTPADLPTPEGVLLDWVTETEVELVYAAEGGDPNYVVISPSYPIDSDGTALSDEEQKLKMETYDALRSLIAVDYEPEPNPGSLSAEFTE